MPNDRFGVKMIYPDMPGSDVPKSWWMEGDWWDGPRMRLDERVSGNGTDGYKLDDNSMVRMTVSADDRDTDIECDNDFAKSTSRGYVYKPNDWCGRANSGVEQTMYVKCSHVDQSDDTVKGNPVIWKGPTGEHHSNTDCCSGSSHMVHVGGEDEDLDNRIAMRFSKEMWHVHYITRSEYKIIPNETWAFTDNRWFGVKYIIYKKTNSGKKGMVIEVYLDANNNNTWKKVMGVEDFGGWGTEGGECNGASADTLAFGNARMMWRWDHRDGNDLRFKKGSIRAIDPNDDFVVDQPKAPTQPSSSTYKSTLKLQRNINSNTGIGCGVGGTFKFHEIQDTGTLIERKLANHATHDFRTIVGQMANNAGSSLVGKTITEALFQLRKVGTPSGTCRAKIWDLAGVERYQSVNTITASALSPTFTSVFDDFDMSTNTRQLVVGDRVGVQYTGTDPDNCIAIRARDPGDGSTATVYTHFSGSPQKWGKIDLRDTVCQFLSTD